MEGRRVEWLGAFPLLFALVVVVKWDTLAEPPFWDTAMGVFAPAITLAANGFDLLGLLALPGYLDGGPNVHSTSPVTFVTALVIMLAGSGRWVVSLHLLHFAAAAWALRALFRLARPSFGPWVAGLLCLSVLLHPTFSVQVGSMYMEVVLFLCAVCAVLAWVEGRFWWAVLWCTLGYATKETGIVIAAALALATLLEQRGLRDKAGRVALLLGLPATWTVGVMAARRAAATGAAGGGLIPSHDSMLGISHSIERFLLNVPDLLVYLGLFAVTASMLGPAIWAALRREPLPRDARDPAQRELLVAGVTGIIIALFALLFLVALPVLAGFTLVLPRYYALILPFLLLWLGYAAKWALGRRSPRAPAVLFAALSVAFLINTSGDLYPLDVDTLGPGNDPALTERSNAYKRLLALELEAMQALEELPGGVPIYYGQYEHYLLRYPGLGYARGPLANGHNLAQVELPSLIQAFPTCLYALFNYPWLGGEKILELLRLAESNPDLSATIVREMRDGQYTILLIRFQRVAERCPV